MAGYLPPLVLTQPDRPAGRGLKLQASAVKQLALAHGLPLAQPRSLRLDGKFPQDAQAAQQALRAAQPDVLVVAAYGLILPQWVLSLPRLGCINIHGSLLPRWRGAAPVQRAIEAGDAVTGICIMQMDAGLDTGDILRSEALAIGPPTPAPACRSAWPSWAHSCSCTLARPGRGPHRAPAAAGRGRELCAQDRQGRGGDRLARGRRRDRAPGARLRPLSRRQLPAAGRKPQALARGGARRRFGAGRHCAAVRAGHAARRLWRDALELLELQRPGGRRQPVAAWLQSLPAGALASGRGAEPGRRRLIQVVMAPRRYRLAAMTPIRQTLLLAAALLVAGCDLLGIESTQAVAERREADGKAVGGACRHAGRALEDCYALNRKADRAAVFAGWREMNDYMRENKIDAVAPQLGAGTELAAKPAPEDKPAKPAPGKNES